MLSLLFRTLSLCFFQYPLSCKEFRFFYNPPTFKRTLQDLPSSACLRFGWFRLLLCADKLGLNSHLAGAKCFRRLIIQYPCDHDALFQRFIVLAMPAFPLPAFTAWTFSFATEFKIAFKPVSNGNIPFSWNSRYICTKI